MASRTGFTFMLEGKRHVCVPGGSEQGMLLRVVGYFDLGEVETVLGQASPIKFTKLTRQRLLLGASEVGLHTQLGSVRITLSTTCFTFPTELPTAS